MGSKEEKLNKIKQIKQLKNKKRIIAIVSLILILIVIIVVMFLLDKQYKTFGGSISEVFEIKIKPLEVESAQWLVEEFNLRKEKQVVNLLKNKNDGWYRKFEKKRF
jgi:flagellar biosynthesis/type III secretory pathway M-ring protein FliF/YscJ